MVFLKVANEQFLGERLLDLLWDASSLFVVFGVLIFGAIFASLVCEE
jgi:hypothetical protein